MQENAQRYFSMAEAYKKVYQLDEFAAAVTPVVKASAAGSAAKGAAGSAAKSSMGSKLGSSAKSFAQDAAMGGAKDAGKNLVNVAKSAANVGSSMVKKPTQQVGEENINEMPAIMPIRPMGPVVVNRTHVSAEVNPQMQKIGDVEKAYYTFPAGFDPTNREDVAEPMKKSQKSAQEQIEIVGDHLLDHGLVAEAEEVDAFYAHMSEEWKQAIIEQHG